MHVVLLFWIMLGMSSSCMAASQQPIVPDETMEHDVNLYDDHTEVISKGESSSIAQQESTEGQPNEPTASQPVAEQAKEQAHSEPTQELPSPKTIAADKDSAETQPEAPAERAMPQEPENNQAQKKVADNAVVIEKNAQPMPSATLVPVQKKEEPVNQSTSQEKPSQTAALPNNEAQKKAADNAASAEKEAEEEPLGINTLSLEEPSGNWLYKRLWYEKAEQDYNQIKSTMWHIDESRIPFFTRRTQADKEIFEPLTLSVGLSQGELSVILEYLMKQVLALKEKEGGSLTPEERTFLGVIAEQQKVLEQLQLDIQTLNKVENALDEALNQLLDQINVAHGYEKEAWQHFRTIAKELSDKVARGHYYHIETLKKNVGDVSTWITHDFSQYIDQLFKTAFDQAERIKQATQSLKEKGIDFKKHAEQLEQEAQKREKDRYELEKKELAEEVAAKTREEMSWLGQVKYLWATITAPISSAWDYVASGACCTYQVIKGLFISEDEPTTESSGAEKKHTQEPHSLPSMPQVPKPHPVEVPVEE